MRLFVAIPIPEELKKNIQKITEPGLPVRWNKPEAYHLTLVFIGEVDQIMADTIKQALQQVQLPEVFDANLSQIGCFPNHRKPKVIWAGVEPQEPFIEMHRDICKVLDEVESPKDDKKLHPHVTIGRVKKPHSGVGDFIQQNREAFFGSFTVSGFNLYSSMLQPGGAKHSVLASYQNDSVQNDRPL